MCKSRLTEMHLIVHNTGHQMQPARVNYLVRRRTVRNVQCRYHTILKQYIDPLCRFRKNHLSIPNQSLHVVAVSPAPASRP